jgi:hypothetical protein
MIKLKKIRKKGRIALILKTKNFENLVIKIPLKVDPIKMPKCLAAKKPDTL